MALKLAVPVASLAVLATACSAAASTSPTPAAAAPASGSVTIDARTGSAGPFLTDSSGRSLYLFASDTATMSTCGAACLSAWPALTTTGQPTAGPGVTAADITTITTAGKKQVVYDGHPLYYFAGDSGAGQTNGQGSGSFGAKWWLVAPTGQQITAATVTAGSTSTTSGGAATSGSAGNSSSTSGAAGSGSSW